MNSNRITFERPARVVVTTAIGLSIEAPLTAEPMVVGSGKGCNLRVNDPLVAARHCELMRTDEGILLRDLGSRTGTLLREVPIREVVLPPDVVVTLGGSTLLVRVDNAAPSAFVSSSGVFGEAVGETEVMRALFAKLERLAATSETILLLGESGTGKEILARAIHSKSQRRGGPFVIFDCSAIAANLLEAEIFGYFRGAFTGAVLSRPGLFEDAHGGTLFIDEIGEMPLELQPKLLRALETRQVRRLGSHEWRSFDVRIIAATHKDLRGAVKAREFREDLYYRIAVFSVNVPPLRARKDDIPLLIQRFLTQQERPQGIAALSPSILNILMHHNWPGNVRELRNAVKRLTVFPELGSEVLSADGMVEPQSSQKEWDPKDERLASFNALLALPIREARRIVLRQFESAYVEMKLKEHGGNISRTADTMGVSRQFVHRLLRRDGRCFEQR